ncbi:MAG: hypothetical protein QNK30_15050 [Bacteroidales bacterium]|nr:hypothetical protein [Bacteroidales bacterium]
MRLLLFSNLLLVSALCLSQENLFNAFEYRNFSPTQISAWISDIAAPENPDSTNEYVFYSAARHGGVWKTSNNGVTFKCITDDLPTTSIGAVEVAPNNPNVVWVGTGESSNARSTHRGYGVYKSINAGEKFTFMGLENTQHIPRIVIHPENENIVYVASMGSLFTPNEDRGVYKTTDGGKSWERIFYINENVGVIDLVINRNDPEILYAAAYEKYRFPWHFEAGGPESGIYKTINGGETWERLSGGLPSGNVGRIGIDIYRKNPDILFTVVENLNPKPGLETKEEEAFDPNKDPYFDRLIGGEVYRSEDAGKSWQKMNHDTVDVGSKAAYSFNQIIIDPNDDRNIYINNVSLQSSFDGGKTWDGIDWRTTKRFKTMFGDVRSLWIDPKDSRHLMAGSDGGLNITYDQGKTTMCFHQIPLGEIYNIELDNASPYNIYAGLQDHEAWKVPSNGWRGSLREDDWTLVGMWDGMYIEVDPENNRWLYTTTQFGSHQRVDQLLGERKNIQPVAGEGKPPYRYTWNTPLILSPHNSSILYTGGQMLLRSVDRGESWQEISPDLTRNDSVKIAGRGHLMYCTISSISESPITPGVLWVGTDDGKVWVSLDQGRTWLARMTELEAIGAPDERYVSRIFASHHKEDRGYVVKTGFRNDDFKPYLYKSDDFGSSWKNIASNLPDQSISAFWEDDTNPEILFVGNDAGVFFTLNGGSNWIALKNNMPNVSVKDIAVHPEERDLVVGTYGRGVYVTDIYPFLELNEDVLKKDMYLFNIEPKPQRNRSEQAWWGNHGPFEDNKFQTPNEANGLHIYYSLGKDSKNDVSILIYNKEGELLDEIKAEAPKGIHNVVWNTYDIVPGEYQIVLKMGKKQLSKTAQVKERLAWPAGNKENNFKN